MKKISKVLWLFIIIMLFVSCEESETVEKRINKGEIASQQSKNSNKQDEESKADEMSIRERYLDKLNSIQEYVDNNLANFYAGTNQEMKTAAGIEYEKWDAALNEIYNDLKTQLAKDDMARLTEEEKEWIKKKESDAKKVAIEKEGGSVESFSYITSIIDSIKERCYYLVNNYMK